MPLFCCLVQMLSKAFKDWRKCPLHLSVFLAIGSEFAKSVQGAVAELKSGAPGQPINSESRVRSIYVNVEEQLGVGEEKAS